MSARAFQVAARVTDPELRVVTIADLGILRSVESDGDRAVVTITPTYTGCPALDTIRASIASALRHAGWAEVDVVTRFDPPWTSDQITEAGRAKLAAAGIAPPAAATEPATPPRMLPLLPHRPAPSCPRCGSGQTDELSRFGPTACLSLWRCRACVEPFSHVKATMR